MKRQARLTFSCTISPNPELLPAGEQSRNARKAKRSVELGRRRNRASTIVLTRESRYETLPGTPSFAQVPRGVWPFEV